MAGHHDRTALQRLPNRAAGAQVLAEQSGAPSLTDLSALQRHFSRVRGRLHSSMAWQELAWFGGRQSMRTATIDGNRQVTHGQRNVAQIASAHRTEMIPTEPVRMAPK